MQATEVHENRSRPSCHSAACNHCKKMSMIRDRVTGIELLPNAKTKVRVCTFLKIKSNCTSKVSYDSIPTIKATCTLHAQLILRSHWQLLTGPALPIRIFVGFSIPMYSSFCPLC